jgi:AbrB family looped-hinge helix DNA binding protein
MVVKVRKFLVMKAVVTSKGQVTIPIAIRTKARISPGSELDFQIEPNGTIKVNLLNQEVSQLKGMIKSKRKKPVSLREMKKAIKEKSARFIG